MQDAWWPQVKETEDAKDDLVDTDVEPMVDEGSDPPEHGAVVIHNTGIAPAKR